MNYCKFHTWIEEQPKDIALITSLDPLNADDVLKKLPEINATGDLNNLISAIKNLMPSIEEIGYYSYHEAIAVIRDLGMFLGSIKKHGVEPAQAIPSLEPILLKLGHMTDMPPRDTLLHICLWNPEGDRQRTYTSHIDEKWLIKSIRTALTPLEKAIEGLILLYETPLDSPDFVLQCEESGKNLNAMVESVIQSIKKVSRKIFAEELRCYYDSIVLQGKEYLGPGAVEMPLYVFDHLLWSAECQDESYVSYKEKLIPYCLPALREIYADFKEQPSLLTKVCRVMTTDPQKGRITTLDGANALMGILKILIKFRMPHKKLVDQAYVYTEHKVREKGSGGYPPEMLDYLNALTLDARERLKQSIDTYQKVFFQQQVKAG